MILPLEKDSRDCPGALLVVPINAIQKGDDWAEVQQNLKRWLSENLYALPNGRRRFRAPGVAFPFTIWRDDRKKGLEVSREAPERSEVRNHLENDIYRALARKSKKLLQYAKTPDTRTVLLLECNNYALTTQPAIRMILLEVLERLEPEGIDEIWPAYHLGDQLLYEPLWPCLSRVNGCCDPQNA